MTGSSAAPRITFGAIVLIDVYDTDRLKLNLPERDVLIAAICFNQHRDTYSPFLLIAKGGEAEVHYRMVLCIGWYNSGGPNYDHQETSYSEAYATLVARITGLSRSYFQRYVQSVVQDKAYIGPVDRDEETIARSLVTLKGGRTSSDREPSCQIGKLPTLRI